MKAYLSVRGLSRTFGDFRAVDDVSFTAMPGEIVALLGPSGCGKTTLLNLIAGFLKPDAGSIFVGDRDLIGGPPHRRDMAMVFQSYALFPHMTVERNVAFGLRMRGVARGEMQKRVAEALALVQLSQVVHRYPKELSGGQQQRVALARALVVRPSVLLLDEPLSNLDALLRKTMREEMRHILKKAGITTLLVTHDQEEALVTADKIILMSAGRVEQMATPSELYERPRTVFSARFMEVTNLFEGVVVGEQDGFTIVETALGHLRAERADSTIGEGVTVAIRPENISLSSDGENRLSGRIMRESYHGAVRRLDVSIRGQTVIAHIPVRRCHVQVGDDLVLSWHADRTRILPGSIPVEAGGSAAMLKAAE